MTNKKLTDNEIGWTQGVMYACGLLAREGQGALAELVWNETNIPNSDAKHCAEYDVSALREIIPTLPKGEA